MVLDNFFNWIFSPLTSNFSPLWSIILLSLILTVFITLIYKLVSNQTVMKQLKQEQDTLRKEMKAVKHDAEKYMEVQKVAMQKSLEYMRHSMKPTLFYIIPLLLIFGWLGKTFKGYGDLVSWGFYIPLFGTGLSWLGVYILASIVFSIIVRKLMRVH